MALAIVSKNREVIDLGEKFGKQAKNEDSMGIEKKIPVLGGVGRHFGDLHDLQTYTDLHEPTSTYSRIDKNPFFDSKNPM